MKIVIYTMLLFSIFNFSFGEQLDPYGACLTNVNKKLKKEIKICDEKFYQKMLKAEKSSEGANYAQMFRACLEKAKADYEIGKTNCEVLYRE